MDSFCFCGNSPTIPFYDIHALTKRFEVESPAKKAFHSVVQVPMPDDDDRVVLAAGEQSSPYRIRLFDLDTKREILSFSTARHSLWGLESFLSPSSDPLVIGGSYGERSVRVFSVTEERLVCSLPDVPSRTCRIMHTPEWNGDVIVSGESGRIHRYDLSREVLLGKYTTDGLRDYVNALSTHVPRDLLVTGSNDKLLRLWSQRDYTCVERLDLSGHGRSVYCAADKHLILVGLGEARGKGGIEVWDCRQTSKRLRILRNASREWVSDVKRLDEDRFVAVSFQQATVVDPQSGSVLLTIRQDSYLHRIAVVRSSKGEGRLLLEEQERIVFAIQGESFLRVERGRVFIDHPFRCFLIE